MKKSRVFLVLLVLLVTLLAGCANQNGEGAAIADIRQLDGQTIGVMTGSTFDQHTDTYINDAKKEYYTTYADMALAVEQGKIAAFLMDEPMARVLPTVPWRRSRRSGSVPTRASRWWRTGPGCPPPTAPWNLRPRPAAPPSPT